MYKNYLIIAFLCLMNQMIFSMMVFNTNEDSAEAEALSLSRRDPIAYPEAILVGIYMASQINFREHPRGVIVEMVSDFGVVTSKIIDNLMRPVVGVVVETPYMGIPV